MLKAFNFGLTLNFDKQI